MTIGKWKMKDDNTSDVLAAFCSSTERARDLDRLLVIAGQPAPAELQVE